MSSIALHHLHDLPIPKQLRTDAGTPSRKMPLAGFMSVIRGAERALPACEIFHATWNLKASSLLIYKPASSDKAPLNLRRKSLPNPACHRQTIIFLASSEGGLERGRGKGVRWGER